MDVYEGLGITEQFKKASIDNSKIDWKQSVYTGTETEASRVQQVITTFDKSIRKKFVYLDNLPGLVEMIFDDDGYMHDQIRGYLEKVHVGKYMYHLQAYPDDNCCPVVEVYSFNQPTCGEVCSLVKKAFVEKRISHQAMQQKQVADFIEEWEKKNKLRIVSSNKEAGSSVVIYMTYDIHFELSKILSVEYENEVHVPLPCYYLVFLKKFGHKVLQSQADMAGVQARIDEKSKTLTLRGYAKDIKHFKTHFRGMLHQTYLPLSHYTKLQWLSSAFDKISEANECTWSVCPLDQAETLDGFKTLTTIYHAAGSGSLSCISGDVDSMKVDALILLVTDKLFPLQRLKGDRFSLFHIPLQNESFIVHTGISRSFGPSVYEMMVILCSKLLLQFLLILY